MKYEVAVQADPDWSGSEELLRSAARHTLKYEAAEEGSLTIVLTNQDAVRDLNRSFAGEDRPTDVLSFVDGTVDPESGRLYFGDIIIAADIARDQADKAGHSLIAELSLLTVHGTLHLLGHDHLEKQEKQRMWSAQKAVLDALDNQLVEGHTE
jgi:probable rRNA maturation factor